MRDCIELQAAYLCLKSSITEDITSKEELGCALQFSGRNPTKEFLEQKWVTGETEFVGFETFCQICEELPVYSENDVLDILNSVFASRDGKVEVAQLREALLSQNLGEESVSAFLEHLGLSSNGFVTFTQLSKNIVKTTSDLRHLSMKKLEEKNNFKRINSLTFTKRKSKSITSKSSSQSDTNSPSTGYSKILRGSFYVHRQSIIAHQYSLEVSEKTKTLIKIKHSETGDKTQIDTLVYIFKESSDGVRNYVGYTSRKDSDGFYFWENVLKEGMYLLVPFITGCRLKQRPFDDRENLRLVEQENDVIKLTEDMIKILKMIFIQTDLDCNGRLNRQEFNLYNWRTSGEEVQDDEWEVVLNNFDTDDGELTLAGFLALHQMEAEDNNGDPSDLWVSLEAMGINKFGVQDHSVPFVISVSNSMCVPMLVVTGLKSGGLLLDKAVIRSIMEHSEPVNLEETNNIIKYEYKSDHHGAVAIQNKGTATVTVRVDCSRSVNCETNRPSLDWTVEVAGKSAIVAHHLMPFDDSTDWSVICDITLH